MTRSTRYWLLALAGLLSLSAHAHRAWIAPSSTVLSGENPWVTFDAAISNTLFHADHAAMAYDMIRATAPDGSEVALQNSQRGKYRSTFDLQLLQNGTYRIGMASAGLTARWQDADGKRQFWPGRGRQGTAEDFAREVPKKATDLQVVQASRRIETFVTVGAPDEGALQTSGIGLEMQPLTHPNDLFAGETARFRFLMDGKPVAGVAVEVIQGGMRYRNGQQEIETQSGKDGIVEIRWPGPGMYWLSAEYSDEQVKKPASQRRGSYAATLEVLPQ